MVARSPLSALVAALLMLSALGCSTPTARAYYVPLGSEPGPVLEGHVSAERDWRVEARCQGAYLNRVDGRRVRTLHLQLDVTRTAPRPMALVLADLRLERLDVEGTPVEVPLAEAWRGAEPLEDELLVLAWTRAPVDLFFDEVQPPEEPPATLRLRWRHAEPSGWRHHEDWFALIDEDDPLRPSDRRPSDETFGYRDGWYMPGLGDLGARALQETVERRSHYVFHSP